MAITYPVTPPSQLKTASAQWVARSTVAVNTSAFTAQQQVIANKGEWWEVSLVVPAMSKREDADALDGFLLSLRGRFGTFWYGDKLRTTSRGNPSGSPKVSIFSGFPPNSTTLEVQFLTGSFAVGDFLQIGNQLVRVTAVHSASSYEVFPRSRGDYGGADIIYTNPKGLFRLKEDPVIPLNTGKIFGPYSFNLMEVVT